MATVRCPNFPLRVHIPNVRLGGKDGQGGVSISESGVTLPTGRQLPLPQASTRRFPCMARYRRTCSTGSSQPSDAGFAWLKSNGIKTIVDLRDEHDDAHVVSQIGFGKYVLHADRGQYAPDERSGRAVPGAGYGSRHLADPGPLQSGDRARGNDVGAYALCGPGNAVRRRIRLVHLVRWRPSPSGGLARPVGCTPTRLATIPFLGDIPRCAMPQETGRSSSRSARVQIETHGEPKVEHELNAPGPPRCAGVEDVMPTRAVRPIGQRWLDRVARQSGTIVVDGMRSRCALRSAAKYSATCHGAPPTKFEPPSSVPASPNERGRG